MGKIWTYPKIRKKRDSVNEHYFKDIDTSDKAYWLGLLFADGYNYQTKDKIKLGLNSQDKYILEKFKTALGTKSPIVDDKNNFSTISIYSAVMCNDLSDLGCTQAKSLTLEFPNIDKTLYKHFIRGYFDGDGSVYINRQFYRDKIYNTLTVKFLGTKVFLSKLMEILKDYNIKSQKLHLCNTKSRKTYELRFSRKGDVQLIRDFIYKDSSLYLERKYNKFYN